MGDAQRHADHGPDVVCRPAGNGLCEPCSGPADKLKPWRDAIADLHRGQRNRRGKRPAPEPAGYVKPPPALPGLDDTTGRNNDASPQP